MDWQWWTTGIGRKLNELVVAGHQLVIFTNQAGVGRGIVIKFWCGARLIRFFLVSYKRKSNVWGND